MLSTAARAFFRPGSVPENKCQKKTRTIIVSFPSKSLTLQTLEPDGALTFELPLPNPERQETFSRFMNGLKAAVATPESLSAPNHLPGILF